MEKINENIRAFKNLSTKAVNKNSRTIVFSCSDNYAPFLAVTLKSIIENTKKKLNYDFYVLTTDLSPENQIKLKEIVESSNSHLFHCVNISVLLYNQSFFTSEHITAETYYRLFAIHLFSNLEKFIYLDSDLILNSDISFLFDIDLQNNYLAAVRDVEIAGLVKKDANQWEYLKNVIGYNKIGEYFQAGVLIFNMHEIKKKIAVEQLLSVLNERQWRYWDQDILNHVFNGKVLYLDQKWNVLMNWKIGEKSRMDIMKNAPYDLYEEYLDARKKPYIIHYAGSQKPWNYSPCDYSDYFWKYARQTVFYEEIIWRFASSAKNDLSDKVDAIQKNLQSRKFFIKLALGKGILYKLAKKIYSLFRKFKIK